MKIKIKSGDTVIEYEEETQPFKNDSIYKHDMILNLINGLVDKVIEIDKNLYQEEG